MSAHVFLSGPMGSGKSTVGRIVAERLGLSFVDLDETLEAREGMSVRDLFATRGEPAFRVLERALAKELAAGAPCVVALGGGTVVDRETRHALLARGTLVTLEAPAAELAARLAGDASRPLLDGGDRVALLEALLAARRAAYAECHGRVSVASRTPAEVADGVVRIAREAPIAVALGERSYRVHVERGVSERLGASLDAAGVGGSVVIVSDANVKSWAEAARARVERSGRRAIQVELVPGEAHKTIASVERIWDAALEAQIDRRAAVVAVGGGVVGDLAGFAAATLLRGIAFAQIPTTLLAMVDSSVGGKTGFDRKQGKNLVGAFHQPRFVLCDPDALSTLPDAELRSGLAEVAKSAWIAGEAEVAMLEGDAALLAERDAAALTRAVRMSVALKARIVSEDETESGPRMLLNLGHTVGHAIEAASGYELRHGECVALGMVAASRIAVALGEASAADARRTVALLEALGLPTDVDAHLGPHLARLIGSDKKRDGEGVRFVVPRAPGACVVMQLPIARVLELAAN